MPRIRAPHWIPTLAVLLVFLGSGASAASAHDPQPPAGEPYRVGGGISAPQKLSGAAPVYTELARRSRVTGTVIVEAVIDEQGNVTNARVLKGLPMGLDRSAVEAVQTWKFKPAMLEGKPVKVYYTLTVNFQVDQDPPPPPLLQKFLTKNPELAEHLKAGRYTEAGQLLDRVAIDWPNGPEIPLARCYLLLKQGQVEAAWNVAKSYKGPDSYEMLYLVGAFARERAIQSTVLGPAGRIALIDLGLEAETMALQARGEGMEAMLFKTMLLFDKAELTTDPQERDALNREAAELRQRAMDLYAKSRRPAGAPQN